MKVSVIIPAINEEKTIEKTLRKILKEKPYEIIVVNGNSKDRTRLIARKYAKVITIKDKTWRSVLMNKGAEKAKGDWLLFLHADTILPKKALALIPQKAIAATYFLRFDNHHWFLRLLHGTRTIYD